MEMISNRPYLLRAFYDWIVDSQCTPVLVADPRHPRCKIPFDLEQDNEVVFNISPTAIRDLDITNEYVQFRASFNGIVHLTMIPVDAIIALYADENNEGLFFDQPEDDTTTTDTDTTLAFSPPNKDYDEPITPSHNGQQHDDRGTAKGRPVLRLVEVE